MRIVKYVFSDREYELHYCASMAEWSAEIKRIYGGRCAWCGRTIGASPHHINRRSILATRLLVENGILLCGRHHTQIGDASLVIQKGLLSVLIGNVRYFLLMHLKTLQEEPKDGNGNSRRKRTSQVYN